MQLLPDKPLDRTTNKSIDFAYDELAKSIGELVSVSPKPFTIGLFGKWGTGKSTIIESLRHTLNKNKYVFVKFDIWKYESDALRRSFLIDMADQLKGRRPFSKINDNYIKSLKSRLYTSTQHDEERFRFGWRTFIVPIAAVVLITIVYLLSKQPIAAAVSGAVGFITLDTLKNIFLDVGNFTQQISIGQDRVNSPEEFYGEFKSMVGMSRKTFVIVIDNLDRTQKEKTIELLSTVKTFLNADDTTDNVVFIIASDDRAIKEHITSTYAGDNSNSRFDANEFLKKFFNVIVELPVFIESEISKYTKKLLNQTDVPEFKNNTDLQQIINYAYSENPREIKQYINNLTAFYVLLTKGVPNNGLTLEFITNNLNYICKLLVTRDRFGNVFDDIKSMAIDNSLTWSEIETKLADKDGTTAWTQELAGYLSFSGLTNWCVPSDESIAWFFRLRRSPEDQRLPGWDLFVNAALQQDYENASKLFSDFSDMDALNNQLTTFINGIHNDPVRLTPFFSVYMRILQPLDDQLLAKLKASIDLLFLHTPSASEFSKVVGLLDIATIASRLSGYARPASFNDFIKILNRYIDESAKEATVSLIPEGVIIKLIDAVDTVQKLEVLKSHLKNEITAHSHSETIVKAISLKNQTLKSELLSSEGLKEFFDGILVSEAAAVEQFRLVSNFNVTSFLNVYLSKLYALVSEISARGVVGEKNSIISIVLDTLNGYSDKLNKLVEPGLSDVAAVSQIFVSWYGDLPMDKDRACLILTLDLFAHIPGNTSASLALDRLVIFISQAEINSLVELLKNPKIDISVGQVQEALKERMASHSEDVEMLMPFANSTSLPYVISHMSQKAIDTGSEDVYRDLIELDHKLYLKTVETDRPTASSYIDKALNSGVERFPDVVKSYWEKKFITQEQRTELKRLMVEYDKRLSEQENQS